MFNGQTIRISPIDCPDHFAGFRMCGHLHTSRYSKKGRQPCVCVYKTTVLRKGPYCDTQTQRGARNKGPVLIISDGNKQMAIASNKRKDTADMVS